MQFRMFFCYQHHCLPNRLIVLTYQSVPFVSFQSTLTLYIWQSLPIVGYSAFPSPSIIIHFVNISCWSYEWLMLSPYLMIFLVKVHSSSFFRKSRKIVAQWGLHIENELAMGERKSNVVCESWEKWRWMDSDEGVRSRRRTTGVPLELVAVSVADWVLVVFY